MANYNNARASFVERLKAISVLAQNYAEKMEESPDLNPDDLDFNVRSLGIEVNNLAYIQGAASVLYRQSKDV